MIDLIIGLLEKGDMNGFLGLLFDSIDNDKKSPFFESIVLLKSNLNELTREQRNGTIHRADFEISKRRITLSIIELAKEIEERIDLTEEKSNRLKVKNQNRMIVPSQENISFEHVSNSGIITVNYKKRNLQLAGVLSLITIVIFIIIFREKYQIIEQKEEVSNEIMGIYLIEGDSGEPSFVSFKSLEFLPNNYVSVMYNFLGSEFPTEFRYEVAGDRIIIDAKDGNVGFKKIGKDTLVCTHPFLGGAHYVKK